MSTHVRENKQIITGLLTMAACIPVERRRRHRLLQMSYMPESGFRKSELFSLTNTGYQGFAFAIMNREDEPPICLRSELTTYVRFSGEKPFCDKYRWAIHQSNRPLC